MDIDALPGERSFIGMVIGRDRRSRIDIGRRANLIGDLCQRDPVCVKDAVPVGESAHRCVPGVSGGG